jgi:hypothetical protein
MGRRALILRRLITAALIAATALAPAASEGANAFQHVVPSLAVIAQVGADDKIAGFGTGFCIGSDAQHSYFATNHHVIAGPGKPKIVAILTSDPATRHPARVVVDSTDPDLAVVEVDVPNVPPLTLSATMPETGDSVAIAGFPWNEGQLWGSLLGGSGFKLGTGQRRFPPELQPSYHSGPVSAIHGGGQYYIQYDALTDHGNSGGPLFDPASGTVYGIVQATVPGMTDPLADTPPSVYNNLAISVREGLAVLARAPDPPQTQTNTVDFDSGGAANSNGADAAGASVGATFNAPGAEAPAAGAFSAQSVARAPGSAACVAGSSALGRAYGAWSQAHGSLKSLEAFVASPPTAEKRALLAHFGPAAVAQRGIDAEAAAIAQLTAATGAIRRARATASAQLAGRLVQAVETATARDRKIAAQLAAWSASGAQPYVRPPGIGTDKSAEAPLGAAADRVSALLDCT